MLIAGSGVEFENPFGQSVEFAGVKTQAAQLHVELQSLKHKSVSNELFKIGDPLSSNEKVPARSEFGIPKGKAFENSVAIVIIRIKHTVLCRIE
jgi:hypothetical protein